MLIKIFASFKLLKIRKVIKLSAFRDNALQDFIVCKFCMFIFFIKDSIQGKKNKCFVRGGHQGLGGILHIK